ncbi:hypothetical protein LCGC14_2961630, partial [marine sediment metagenome]
VLMWFSRKPGEDSAGIMLRGVKLTIYNQEYINSNPVQRLVIAVLRLNVFIDDVEIQR